MSVVASGRIAEAKATFDRGPVFVRLLGEPVVLDGRQEHPLTCERRHVLLAYLAASGHWIDRDHLAAMLWPDHDRGSALRNLRYVLFQARALPYCTELQVSRWAVRWSVDTDQRRLRNAHTARNWATALQLCRGTLLEGVEFPEGLRDWIDAQRIAAQNQWRDAVLAELHQHADRAIAAARNLLAHDPFDEPVVLALCQSLRRLDRMPEAAKVARDYALRVRRDLGVEPAVAMREFLDSAASGVAGAPAQAELTPFFGRTAELRDIVDLSAEHDCRLLSLVGIGGSGKTRLARRIAEDSAGPVVWVTLETVAAGELVGSAIARACDPAATEASGRPEHLVQMLSGSVRLLVLDNVEQVKDAVALLVAQFLRSCPRLRVLTTSRVRLGIDGEWVFPVDGFACAKDGCADGEAEQFFVHCAQRAMPDFAPSDADRASVHALAVTLAGNPLALELAAYWVRSLPLSDIVAELQRDIGMLAADGHGQSERQLSLSASFDYSWRLLSQREREALARLAVFRGGFTREAASHVAELALPVLASLVDRSLLRFRGDGRYDRHPLVHQFTQEKLLSDPALTVRVRQRHAEYFLSKLEDNAQRSLPRRQRLHQLRAEWPNILLATEWFAECANWSALGRCSDLIGRDPSIFGNLDVGADWAGRILALAERAPTPPPAALIAQIRSDRLWLQVFLEHPDRTRELARLAWQIACASKNVRAQTMVLRSMGHLARKSASFDEAATHFQRALRLARRHGLIAEEGMLLDALAMVETQTGALRAARSHAVAALAINERVGNLEQRMYNYYNIGESDRLAGRASDAQAWLEQCVALAREIEFEQFLSYALVALAECHLQQNRHVAALACAQEAREVAHALDDPTAGGLAAVALARIRIDRVDETGAHDELLAALRTALRWNDGLVLVALLPVVARLFLRRDRRREARRWLKWLAERPHLSHGASVEARALLAQCDDGGLDDAEASQPSELAPVAREMEVALAADDWRPASDRSSGLTPPRCPPS